MILSKSYMLQTLVAEQREWKGNNYHHLQEQRGELEDSDVCDDAEDPLWVWNPEQTSPEVRNKGISGQTKKGLMSS